MHNSSVIYKFENKNNRIYKLIRIKIRDVFNVILVKNYDISNEKLQNIKFHLFHTCTIIFIILLVLLNYLSNFSIYSYISSQNTPVFRTISTGGEMVYSTGGAAANLRTTFNSGN